MSQVLSQLERVRVLVVDNEQTTLDVLQTVLSGHVAEIFWATDVESGMANWSRHQPDIALIEYRLPDGDGLDMCKQIRALDPDATIMVMAAATDPDYLHRIIGEGIDAHIAKPIDEFLLLDRFRRCLRDRQRVLDLKMASLVFEVVNEGIIITDEKSRILAVNPAFSVLTGYRPNEVVGMRTSILSSGLHAPDFYRLIWDSLLTHGRWSGELTNRRKDGSHYEQWLSIAAVDGQFGFPRRYVGLISDITERKREEERVRRLAHIDSLTGVANRVLFHDRLHRSIARAHRYRYKLAILYVDLDHFKQVNDNWGHAAGDEVLRVAASRMVHSVRVTDTVSRRGGDEFVLIIEQNDDPEELGSICQKLLSQISRSIPLGTSNIQVDASIGVAIYPDDAEQPEDLLAAADMALYEAKSEGRSRFRFYRQKSAPNFRGRLDMEQALRDGLVNWRYAIRYLPEISLQTGKVEHVEALLRFQHPEFGLLDAGRFLEIAEEIGIMPELGHKALVQAASELTQISGELGLVVDLSARQLMAPDAVKHLLAILLKAGVPTERITFECTESALTGNEWAVKTVLALAESGCKFSLDDFGAGYCSFGLLSQLPMNSIKIDRSFVAEIVLNPQMRSLVSALVAFGKQLGVRVIAEGVENLAQLEILREVGCDAAQGYLFGRPVGFDDLGSFSAGFKSLFESSR